MIFPGGIPASISASKTLWTTEEVVELLSAVHKSYLKEDLTKVKWAQVGDEIGRLPSRCRKKFNSLPSLVYSFLLNGILEEVLDDVLLEESVPSSSVPSSRASAEPKKKYWNLAELKLLLKVIGEQRSRFSSNCSP